ncbi:MAG: response regulator [Lentisphaeraceae bacterium]|nr:response regulator [Lentisphaeraceae bacterium]
MIESSKEKKMLQEIAELRQELKDSKRMFQLVLDTIPARVFWKDRDLNFLGCNRGFLNDAGLERYEDIIGSSDLDQVWKDNAELFRDDDRKVINEIEGRINYEEIQRIEEGREMWVRTTKVPLINAENKVIGVFGSYEDITEQKEAEAELEASRMAVQRELEGKVQEKTHELTLALDKAEEANRAKSAFLANMSHEIRTPMNAVLGFSEILKELESDPHKAHYLEYIHSSGNALLSIIDDILDLSKIEAGKFDLQYTSFSVNNLCRELKTIFSKKCEDKDIRFKLDVDEKLPLYLVMDGARLRQILLNLCSNAIKFTSTGHVIVKTSFKQHKGSSNCVDLTISVEDTGIGIAEDQQEKVFGAFEQSSGQKTVDYGGTGLGLAISKRLIELMSGDIFLKSESGKGSTFSIEIAAVEVAASTHEKTLAPMLSDISFKQSTILICDDIDYNREILRAFTSPYGFKIFEASNGQEALDVAAQCEPDLILMDMKMPHMSGYEACRRLRQDTKLKHIPLIAVTASALVEDEKVIRKYCDEYLRKPISKNVLISTLRKFLTHNIVDTAADLSGACFESEAERKGDVEGLLRELKKIEAAGLAQQICEAPSVNNIIKFSNEMSLLAEDFGSTRFSEWSSQLTKAANSFDVEEVKSKLSRYHELIQELEN